MISSKTIKSRFPASPFAHVGNPLIIGMISISVLWNTVSASHRRLTMTHKIVMGVLISAAEMILAVVPSIVVRAMAVLLHSSKDPAVLEMSMEAASTILSLV